MPLVPKPFDEAIISRQSVFGRPLGLELGGHPMASTWCRFCPNLNFVQYLQALTEEKETELYKRAFQLTKRSCINQHYKASEFSWEVFAWQDVFGLILNDEALRVDKRPYEFSEDDNGDQSVVKIKIPDATIGLVSYDNGFLEQGYICNNPNRKDNHSAQEPDERLPEELLAAMMNNHKCGLVVDGVWGKTDLLFPFAVYEAKKRAHSYAAAEEQIYRACRTYLAMLDDLARNPDNISEYQSEDSKRYQLFAFTSCGAYWEVFVAWNFINDCMGETLWEGDVKDKNAALELISSPFRHEASRGVARPTQENSKSFLTRTILNNDNEMPDSARFRDSIDKAGLPEFYKIVPRAKWETLKTWSIATRNEKAQQTRAHNRMLKMLAANAQELEESPELEATPQLEEARGKKRPRGSPPKTAVHKNKVPKMDQQAEPSSSTRG
ncbi:hypothetical protein F53441_1104 [Fusarium austroafricanum]|uniref:Uncharacterized protein n=1 Tax=Fusarium austroafricanum TaxID=2364996 RepID=A0A8H4KW98_9HYPO|nr:hypothetical protein F53441_1104 [Fusarium austroafricanum]